MKILKSIISGFNKAKIAFEVIQAVYKGLSVTIEELKKINFDETV